MPIYCASTEQMTNLVERNGNLIIERMEPMDPLPKHFGQISGKDYAMNLRSGMEGILGEHFGRAIIDEVFDRFYKKILEFFHLLKSSHKDGTQLLLVLRRK